MFPKKADADVTIGELEYTLESLHFIIDLDDDDAVRVALLYIVCVGFFGKLSTEKVCAEWLVLVDDLNAWNRYC